MSGSCRDCGHDLCICDELAATKPPSLVARIAALERELAEALDVARNFRALSDEAIAKHDAAEAALAAERIENTHLREAFVTMEKAYNANEAALAALQSQRCETCQHNDYGDCALTLHVEVSDLGCRFESWTSCERFGNGCRAWARREP